MFTWVKSSFRSFGTSRTGKSTAQTASISGVASSKGNKFQRLADPTDQLYQLDTIHLVGKEDRENLVTTTTRDVV